MSHNRTLGIVFTSSDGMPILAVRGDWWLSKQIFDLVVKRVEAEGTAGAIATGLVYFPEFRSAVGISLPITE